MEKVKPLRAPGTNRRCRAAASVSFGLCDDTLLCKAEARLDLAFHTDHRKRVESCNKRSCASVAEALVAPIKI